MRDSILHYTSLQAQIRVETMLELSPDNLPYNCSLRIAIVGSYSLLYIFPAPPQPLRTNQSLDFRENAFVYRLLERNYSPPFRYRLRCRLRYSQLVDYSALSS